jgi:uncharacterized protein YyaL (SSP411 family)
MPNRLIHEKSPYLLQHAHNPVDWYPWGEEAFETARRSNKPIFLSVGYATCHWCHVMEREAFEDLESAAVLNESFVCIKVDREERPDIDAVYMAACQMITGGGGWPLSILMTPDKKPFFAGTYIPKRSGLGRVGLIDLCRQVTALAKNDPQRIRKTADVIAARLDEAFQFENDPEARPDTALPDQACRRIMERYDHRFGGFDGAPKFPMPHRLLFLLQVYARTGEERLLQMIVHTLKAMRLGGLWDHVGYGFHRYATDRAWLLPHFEKMLYDQALLAKAYLAAYEQTGLPLLRETARDILTYVLRDMTDPRGGFYTAEDADSEGQEGKFYLWTQEAFEQVAGDELQEIPWRRIFNLEPEGNFLEEATQVKTGANILHLSSDLDKWAAELNTPPELLTDKWEQLRRRLFARREARIHPLKDDKVLTDWNGLMIAAMAQGGRVLDDPRFKEAAEKAAGFVLEHLVDQRGALLHRYREGQAAIAATANDYAFLIMGLVELYRSLGEPFWLTRAEALQTLMNGEFWQAGPGGFHLTAADRTDLPVRPIDLHDGALPSANAVALNNLLNLSRFTGRERWRRQALHQLQAFAASVRRQPVAYTHTLTGWERALKADGRQA